jgi:hypothetical protein
LLHYIFLSLYSSQVSHICRLHIAAFLLRLHDSVSRYLQPSKWTCSRAAFIFFLF